MKRKLGADEQECYDILDLAFEAAPEEMRAVADRLRTWETLSDTEWRAICERIVELSYAPR